jgi:DNA invertase Pin-like site-specific DNA recombinase
VTGEKVLIGYMRVSKADGSQSTNLQRDALIAAGVSLAHLYEDLASGRRDDRPGLVWDEKRVSSLKIKSHH